jgi:hypothetical protein
VKGETVAETDKSVASGSAEVKAQMIATTTPGFDEWWSKLVAEMAPMIAQKAQEYGSNSLAEMGLLFARARSHGGDVTESQALELGCYQYAYGKMQRVVDAMLHDRLPSEDTLTDLMVYAAMALFIRQNKRWP